MKSLILFILLFIITTLWAQKSYTLKDCIATAIQNRPTMEQNKLSIEKGKVNLRQSKFELLPNLNGFAFHNYSFGSTIDPTTNARKSLNIQNDQFVVNSELEVLNWTNFITISIEKSGLENAEKQQEVLEQQLASEVIQRFYQYQYDSGWEKVLQSQLKGFEEQIKRTEKEVEIGTRPQSDIYDIKANFGNIMQSYIRAKNQAEVSKTNLLIAMNIESDEEIEFEAEEDILIEELPSNNVSNLIDNQPVIQSYHLRIKQQLQKVKRAKSLAYPVLSAEYRWSTFYSKELRTTPASSFGKQFNDDNNQFAGLSLNIPIFNRRRVRSEMELERLNTQNLRAELQEKSLELKQVIQKLQIDYFSAVEEYELLEENFSNQELSFARSEEKFEEGLIDSYTFFVVQRNWLEANYNLIRSRFNVLMQQNLLKVYGIIE